MLAVRGERALLGRNRRRPGARFSCLAGFVEPGETLEEAVRREVREESGVRRGRVRYLASQPWPFPSSLMMGFLAEALTEEITVDPEELAEARWFGREEIGEMVARAADRPRRPDTGLAAAAARDRASDLPAMVERDRPPVIGPIAGRPLALSRNRSAIAARARRRR